MKFLTRLFVPALVALLAMPLVAGAARTETPPNLAGILTGVPSVPDGARTPEAPAASIALPLKKTDVNLHLTGGLIEGEVAQVFTNNTNMVLEAVYVFP